MAIIILSGKPRSGKTYKAVHDLLMKETQRKFFIFHNINGLKPVAFDNPEHVKNWQEFIREKELAGEEDFFCMEYQEGLAKAVKDKYGKNVLFVIDESHIWFDKSRKSFKTWLAMHGHLGQEVWLISQRATMLSSSYRALAEYEIRAKSDHIFNVPFVFLYQKIANGEACGGSWIRKKTEVYQAYKSFQIGMARQHASLLIPMFLALVFGGGYYLYNTVGSIFPESKKGQALAAVAPQGKGQAFEVKTGQKEKRTDPVRDSLDGYSLASILGHSVYVQSINGGGMVSLQSVCPDCKVVESGNATATALDTRTGRYYRITRKSVQITDSVGAQRQRAPAESVKVSGQ